MNVRQVYNALSERIPPALSCAWDRDGLMCCPDENKEVKKVLIALDITAQVVHEAVAGGYDLVVSHHPLIFNPLKSLDPKDPVAGRVIKLLVNGISAFSFHTRLDAVEGGVNDTLTALLGIRDTVPFGEDGIGRVGVLEEPMSLDAFAARLKAVTHAGCVQYVPGAGEPTVKRVAVVGGSGSSDLDAAYAAGADTFVTGDLKHNCLADAPCTPMNLLAAGHFHTEHPVCTCLLQMVQEILPAALIRITSSDTVRYL